MNGHSVKNRLDVFALNPAPIQIAYLGYPNTTGLQSIKYRITDNIADNPESTQQYTEKLLYMPNGFLLFEPNFQENRVVPNPTSNTQIILGSINKENKVSDDVLSVWKIILDSCPNVKIIIKLETFDNNEDRLKHYVEKLGEANRDKIEIVNKLQNLDYYTIFSKFDILLDTFPYSGTTTTCNALYNSVPVVTMYNKNYHCHNVSSSILKHTGLAELIAYSKEEYINIVISLVNNPNKINHYKHNINPMFMKSMTPTRFMPEYEGVLIDIYKHTFFNEELKTEWRKEFVEPIKEEPVKEEPVKKIIDDNTIIINF